MTYNEIEPKQIDSVVFLPVQTLEEKLSCLSQLAYLHFQKKQKLHILVSDEKAYRFIDELLWKSPLTSFLPHPSSLLTLSLKIEKESYPSLCNLTASCYQEKAFVKTLYELEDRTSEEKKKISENRYQHYKQLGYSISYLHLK